MVKGHGQAHAGGGAHWMYVLPTAQCPDRENHSQGAAGVSWTSCLELCSWSQASGRSLWGQGGTSTSPPAIVLCHCPVTSAPFLFLEKCPHFTDGENRGLEIHPKFHSWELVELEQLSRLLAQTRDCCLKEGWGLPFLPRLG